jgi:glycosyltransferase involved in cell wall biosynthesis
MNARIVIVLSTLELGGAERQALHLASYLQDSRKASVAIVALFGGIGDQPVRRLCIERRLPCLRVNMPEHRAAVPSFAAIRQFVRDIRFLQPDLLLPYTTLPNVLCGLAWRVAGARGCIWNQRDEGRELQPNGWHAAAIRNVSHFISNSRDGVDCLVREHHVPTEKIQLIYNGVDLPPPTESRRIMRERLAVAPDSFVAVMLANIHAYKDHPTLVRAWRIVCDRLPERSPTLLLAGRADAPAEVEHLIASLGLRERVRLIGPVGDVSSLLGAVDLSVFSSHREGTPNAVLESMAAGLAVVATDIPGCRDALGDGYLFLTPARDADAMATAILALATDDAERHRLGEAGAIRAREKFSLASMCERTALTLSALLQKA